MAIDFSRGCQLKLLLILVLVAGTHAATSVAFTAEPESAEPSVHSVDQFLKNYCIGCHDADTAEGQREFDSFSLSITTQDQLIAVDEIIDQVTLRQMPPPDAKQPGDEERLTIVEALRKSLRDARDQFSSTGGRTVMRRLSHREYENTLATLFQRRVDTLGLTADFPRDNAEGPIDHIGSAMVTSGFLLDRYFAAANRLVDLRLNKPSIAPQTWHFVGNFRQYEELEGPHRDAFNFRYLCLYEQPNTDTRQGGYGHIEDFLDGVPVSGLYDVEVLAQAMHRDTHYDPKIFRIDFSEPFEMAVVPGDVTKGHIHYPQAIEPILAQAIVPDEEPTWLKFPIWLEAGQTPRFIFPNGPYESRASVIEINKRYADEFHEKLKGSNVSRTHLLRDWDLPHIRISEVKIHGPLGEEGGGTEELAVFGEHGFQSEHALEQVLAFAERAFRRPLNASDRKRLATIYETRLANGESQRTAALDTIKMILCSPSFLYLSEITPEGEWLLGGYDLASRLSYTLWSAPPDEELYAAAKGGELTDVQKLRQQVNRLLDDERANEFVRSFLDSWLSLKDIGSLPPPRKEATQYYAEELPQSMKEESRYFFRHLLDQNGPITDFLSADYTFVDKKLATLYALPDQKRLRLADGFKRVSLKDFPQRGGVLGMAGVLTVSANGVDTSPVTRGVWVLKNILGTPPPPPPDVVPAIDSDVTGATTIRQRLALHSQDAACSLCHQKIDPLGFALESFDPIGRWRTKYPKPSPDAIAAPIDTSGKFSSGESYRDFAEFKQILVETRQEVFTRHLIETLLAFATGRQMERIDRFEIDDIQQEVQSENHGLRTLIVAALTSKIFRSR
jgi:hypothetical protein